MKIGKCARCKRDVYDAFTLTAAQLLAPERRRPVLAAPDFNASHTFCVDCLEAEEIEQAKQLDEWPQL